MRRTLETKVFVLLLAILSTAAVLTSIVFWQGNLKGLVGSEVQDGMLKGLYLQERDIDQSPSVPATMHVISSPSDSVFPSADSLPVKSDVLDRTAIDPATVKANVTYFVLSSRNGFAARQAVRQTWGRGVKDLIFVVGKFWCSLPMDIQSNKGPCSADMSRTSPEKLRQESESTDEEEAQLTLDLKREKEMHGDILMLDMIDSYGNLAEKTLKTVLWAAVNRPSQWMIKADDDIILNTNLVEELLAKLDKKQKKVVGSIMVGNSVRHEGKWADFSLPEGMPFPEYPQGAWSYALSPALVKFFYENEWTLKLYRNEDTMIGMWLDYHFKGIKNSILVNDWKFRGKYSYNRNDCTSVKFFNEKAVYGHKIAPDAMRECWQHLQTIPVTQP